MLHGKLNKRTVRRLDFADRDVVPPCIALLANRSLISAQVVLHGRELLASLGMYVVKSRPATYLLDASCGHER